MDGERQYDDSEIESSMKSEGPLWTISSALNKSSAGTFGDSLQIRTHIMILAVDIGKAFLMVSMSEVARYVLRVISLYNTLTKKLPVQYINMKFACLCHILSLM